MKDKDLKLLDMEVDQPTHDQIAARAYELFEQRGRVDGFDKDDWLQAEQELLGE